MIGALLSLLFFNLAEYLLHRFPMHRAGSPLYDHVLIHHRFPDQHMFLPPETLALIMVAIGSGTVWLLGFAGLGPAATFAGFGVGYYFAYELTHWLWHRCPGLWLARHHLAHHRNAAINFNITLPMFDYVFGTKG